jgi:hypothetical protein
VRHSSVGGVTDGSYWVGTNTTKDTPQPTEDPNFRALRDILSPVENGLPIVQPPVDSYNRLPGEGEVRHHSGLLLGSSLLPLAGWDSPVAALLVFEKNGWCERSLTTRELAIAFDLPVGLHGKWKWIEDQGSLSFLGGVPSKVVMAFAHEICGGLPIKQEGDETYSTRLPPRLKARRLDKSGIAVKAARPDDAEAEIGLWNDELVTAFPNVKGVPRDELDKKLELIRS